MVLFFFFKQKTAYEMRISDWSSDVCSSDLGVLVEAGLDAKAAKLRAKQIWHWIYHRGVTDFEAMTDIAKTMRPWLTDRFIIGRPTVREAQVSSDGTRKWLLAAADGQEYAMVFIPDGDRGTLCVSSKVGGTLKLR